MTTKKQSYIFQWTDTERYEKQAHVPKAIAAWVALDWAKSKTCINKKKTYWMNSECWPHYFLRAFARICQQCKSVTHLMSEGTSFHARAHKGPSPGPHSYTETFILQALAKFNFIIHHRGYPHQCRRSKILFVNNPRTHRFSNYNILTDIASKFLCYSMGLVKSAVHIAAIFPTSECNKKGK